LLYFLGQIIYGNNPQTLSSFKLHSSQLNSRPKNKLRNDVNMRQLQIFSTKPKLDMQLFVDFCVFEWICLMWIKNCSVLIFRTILGPDQANSVKNTEINKQLHFKFWCNTEKYETVLYSSNQITKKEPKSEARDWHELSPIFLATMLFHNLKLFLKPIKNHLIAIHWYNRADQILIYEPQMLIWLVM
jgi:hypothetical protein